MSSYDFKLLPERKKAWIEALRSGEFKQGSNALITIRPDGTREHCGLGVLVELADRAGVLKVDHIVDYDADRKIVSFVNGDLSSESAVLPIPARLWAFGSAEAPYNPRLPYAPEDGNGRVYLTAMTRLNDHFEVPFEELADLIEEHL